MSELDANTMFGGAKKHAKKSSKKDSKKGGKKGSKKMSRGMPQFMVDLMAAKKEIKSHNSDIKDGPPLTKIVAEALKAKGSVKGAVEHINNMSASELKSKIEKVAKAIAEKRASKKASKEQSRPKRISRGMPQFMVDMMAIKKEVKAKHTDIKDGPALSKVVSEALKSKGSVKDAIEHLNDMSSSDLKSKLDKVNREIAEKRASKKSA
jgi:hypothetical protein